MDNEYLKLADVDIKFVATVSDKEFKSNPRNPDRGIVRHQFLEALVRLAEEKYYRSKKTATLFDAIHTLLEKLSNSDFSLFGIYW